MTHTRIGIAFFTLGLAWACSPAPAPSSPFGGAGESNNGGTGGTSSSSAGANGGAGLTPTSTGGTPFFDIPVGGESSGSADGGCARAAFESDLLPTNILFVVDRSAGMNCLPETPTADCNANPPPPQPGSKWESTVAALGTAFSNLAGISGTSAGILYYSNDDTCGTNSQPSVGVNPLTQPQIDALNATLTAMVPAGGTPIIGATINAYHHIHDEMQLPGNRFVVLISDGIDTCLEPWRYTNVPNVASATEALDLFNDRVAAAAAPNVNIRTFVIGVPGSEGGRAFLSSAAFLGGTASSATCDHSASAPDVGDCHFDMAGSADFGADLAEALNQITGRAALTCEFAVPSGEAEVDPDKVNVSFYRAGTTEVPVLKDATLPCDGGAQGWQYTDDSNTKIIVCGSVCDEIRNDPEGRVEIILGCPTEEIVR